MMPLTIEREPWNGYQFPPGFRFHPSDEELIVHYLQNKAGSRPLPASIIADIDLYKFNPWELPRKALFGDDEWFFFSPRDRKYPNGARPNRSAGSGYWKATGTDRPILTSSGSISIGVKKSLVFYKGRPPKGLKTEWVMNEYRLPDTTIKPSRSKGSMRLDDWVLCRVRHKGNELSTKTCEVQDKSNQVLASYLPKAEETLQPAYSNSNNDMIRDCLNKSCPILASILAAQTISPETISCISFQGTGKGTIVSSVFEDNSDNSPTTISSFHPYSPVKRTSNFEYSHNNLLAPNKKLNSGNKSEGFLPSGELIRNNDLNLYRDNQSQDIFNNSNQSDSIIGFLELNELDLICNYLE